MKEVLVEEGLEEIGDGAFAGCHNLLFVTLPETLKKIGDYAFSFFIGGGTGQKYRINFVAVPESVEDISESFFDYASCPAKRVASKGSKFEAIIRENKYKYENYPCRRGLLMSTKAKPDFDPYSYISCGEPVPTSAQNENTSAEENGERKEIVDLVIPARKKIIQKNAYENCETLKTITLSKSLERIEESAFRNCPAISEIVFGDKLSYIGARAFQATEKKGYLRTLTIPGSVKHIGDQAFDGFVIEELILLEGIESIGENAFSGFAGAVELPVSLSNYSKNAFGPNAFLSNNPTLKKKLNESKAVMEEKRIAQQKTNVSIFGERKILAQTERNYEEEMGKLESLKKKKEEVAADRESFISNAGLTEKRIIKQIECTRNVIEVYKDQLAHLSVFAFSQKKEISARIQKEEEILRNTINELEAHREKTASDMNSFLKRNEEIEEEMRECIEKCDGLSKGIKGLEASIKAFEASEKEFNDLVEAIAAQEKLISMNMDTLRIRNDSYKKGLAK